MSLSEGAAGAVTVAAHGSDDRAERWFAIIMEQSEALETPDWAVFSANFKSAAAAEQYSAKVIKKFIEHVESLDDPLAVVDEIGDEDNWSAVLTAYKAREENADAFYAYLKREWDGYWNGRPETWEAFAAEVVADATDEGFPKNAAGWRDYVGGADDKGAAMAEYGLTVGEEDGAAFYAYLKRDWDGYWNGKPDTWEAFADEVVSGATAQGFPKNVAGWREYVGGAHDKVAAMAEYGLTVAEEDGAAFYDYLKSEWDEEWNGQPEAWASFADEVVSDATARGFPKNAQGWRDYVESAPDKVAAMAEYGLTVVTVTPPDGLELAEGELQFDPAHLLKADVVDASQLEEAVAANLLAFDPLDDDELEEIPA